MFFFFVAIRIFLSHMFVSQPDCSCGNDATAGYIKPEEERSAVVEQEGGRIELP